MAESPNAAALEQQLAQGNYNAVPELRALLVEHTEPTELVRACAALETFFCKQLHERTLWYAEPAQGNKSHLSQSCKDTATFVNTVRAWCAQLTLSSVYDRDTSFARCPCLEEFESFDLAK